MGDESDALWDAHMIEEGREDTERWLRDQRIQSRNGVPFKKQKKGRKHPPQERKAAE